MEVYLEHNEGRSRHWEHKEEIRCQRKELESARGKAEKRLPNVSNERCLDAALRDSVFLDVRAHEGVSCHLDFK